MLVANPAALTDIAARVGAGEAWTGKRLRQRADYLWRMVARGSTRATPRGWLAHVALLRLDPTAPHGPLPPLSPPYATESSDNLHLTATVADRATPGSVLTIAPLYQDAAGRTRFWVVRPDEPTRLRELTVRTTPELMAIRGALRAGALGSDQLWQATAADLAVPPRREVFDGLVAHLVGLGVLGVSRRPLWTVGGWRRSAAELPAAGAGGYVDVYRRPSAGLSLATAAGLAGLVDDALRVLAVLDADGPPPSPPAGDRIGTLPRPLLEVVAEDVAAEHLADRPTPARAGAEPDAERGHRHDWPPVGDPASPYGRLHGWLTARLDAGPVDLDLAALAVPAPARPELDWPADCLVRPLWMDEVRPWSVLDRLEPTGILDARFADGLAGLFDAGTARTGWYREFLREVEEAAGGRFVELLAPPLSGIAANAVRRPAYTRLWTGDPDLRRYCRPAPGRMPRFIPLADITVRDEAGQRVVAAGGEPIWPVYHATRRLPPPWDAVARRLLGSGPAPARSRWRTLRYSLPAWPRREFVPRITVGGGALVLTCAQWRVGPAQLWPATASLPAKARALDRLRRRLDLPRWVTAAGSAHDEPTACDLRSLQAVATLDRLLRRDPAELYVAELLPPPRRLPVADRAAGAGGGSLAELLLRLPLGMSPAMMAARAAAAYRDRMSRLATVH
jgi:hypothetical protein